MTLISIDAESDDWDEVVRSMTGHSVYQSAAYHRLAAAMDGGDARLYFFEQGKRRVAIPLIVRDIDPAFAGAGRTLRDATSVYGYPGVLSNTHDAPQPLIDQFQFALQQEMRRENIVTVFVRLDTIRSGSEFVIGLGDVEKIGDTIAIDLSTDDETRFRTYRRNHRCNIKKLREMGAQTVNDPSFCTLPAFEDDYRTSMQRVGAKDWFSFGLPYFQSLCAQRPNDIVLLQTKIDGQLACGGLFFCSGDVAYAHLTATDDQWAHKSPTKVLFDDAASYFRRLGYRWLHIGGGLGARQDSLYRFKCGFSSERFPFHVWKYVVDARRYQQLCRRTESPILGEKYESFFPQYRADTVTHPERTGSSAI